MTSKQLVLVQSAASTQRGLDVTSVLSRAGWDVSVIRDVPTLAAWQRERPRASPVGLIVLDPIDA